jgi:HEAT repeat protein
VHQPTASVETTTNEPPDVISLLAIVQRCGDSPESENAVVDLAGALHKLEAASPDVIRALITALHGDNADVRWHVAGALGKLGATTFDAVVVLAKVLHGDKDSDVRWHAAVALWRIVEKSPAVFLDGLRLALTGDNSDARRIAAKVIGYYAEDDATRRTLEDLAAKTTQTKTSTPSPATRRRGTHASSGFLARRLTHPVTQPLRDVWRRQFLRD